MSTASIFHLGDVVRLAQVPPAVLTDAPVETLAIFQRALGHTFVVRGFGRYGHVELEVSKIERGHTIWVEPECLRRVRRRARGAGGK